MEELDLADAEGNFFALVDEVAKGASIVIKRDGRPAAKLVPLQPEAPQAYAEPRRK
jgi:prevent-host-death family protein